MQIPDVVCRTISRQILIGQKHSPTILFVSGVIGVVATTVLACRATLKLDETLDVVEERINTRNSLQHRDQSLKERSLTLVYMQNAADVGKLYAPAFIVGVASIAALTGSHRILTNRNSALTAAYIALQKGFDEYRRRVVEDQGEEKDREYRYGTEEYQKLDDATGKVDTAKRVGPSGASIHARFFDQLCPSWEPTPEANLFFLKCQERYATDRLRMRGHIFLNEVYDGLGMERTKAGQVVGWILSDDEDNFVDFGLTDPSNRKVRDFVNGREGAVLVDFNISKGTILSRI